MIYFKVDFAFGDCFSVAFYNNCPAGTERKSGKQYRQDWRNEDVFPGKGNINYNYLFSFKTGNLSLAISQRSLTFSSNDSIELLMRTSWNAVESNVSPV